MITNTVTCKYAHFQSICLFKKKNAKVATTHCIYRCVLSCLDNAITNLITKTHLHAGRGLIALFEVKIVQIHYIHNIIHKIKRCHCV